MCAAFAATLSQIVGQKKTHTHARREIPLKTLKKAKRSENRMRRWLVRGRKRARFGRVNTLYALPIPRCSKYLRNILKIHKILNSNCFKY